MASGTVGYTDTRSEKNYLGSIAKLIGNRLKQASNMASEERAYASKKAEDGGTSLEEAGIGRGYFFKRALGSRFGGDRIARTRGRLGATGPGTNPTKNYKQRFRGGFDYNVTNEIQSATVPLSSALVSGMRGVESGLSDVSQSLVRLGDGLGDLARGQNDLAKATYFNGMILRVMVTEIKRQQSRLAGRREERSIEGGRPALPGGSGGSGGRRMINITPGAGGGKGTDFGDIARGAGQFLTNKSAYKTGGSLYKGGSGAYKSLRAGTNVVKNIPSAVDIATTTVRNIEKVKTPIQVASDAKKLVAGGAAFMGEADKAPKIANTVSKFFGAGSRIKKKMGPGAAGLGEIVEATVTNLDPKDAKALAATRKALAPGVGLASLGDDGLGMITNSPDVLKALDKADDVSDGAATAKTIAAAADAGASKAGLLSFLRGRKPKGLVRGSAFTRMLVRNPAGKAFLKKLPLIGAVAGGIFAIQRLLEGDFLGAGLELGSGLLGATGLAPASLALDGLLLARDFGAVPFAKGGLLTGRRPVNALMGEAGPEIVTPLNDQTFIKFGEGFIDAQKRNKSDYAKIQAEGLKQYYEKQGGWEQFGRTFSGIVDALKSSIGGLFNGINPMNLFRRSPNPPPLTPPPPVGNTEAISSVGAKGVLDLIASVESNGSYDVFNSSRGETSGKASEKTIGWLAENAQGAIGRYQHMPEFILDRAIRAGYNKDTVFTPEVQDALTIQMLKDQHSLDDFLSGKTTPEAFAAKLAPTWRGLPQGDAAAQRLGGTADSTYNDQYASGNKAHMSWQDSVTNLRRIQTGIKSTPKTTSSLEQPDYIRKWIQGMGVADQQANVLGMNSTNASLAGFQMVTPTIVNNNYYTSANQSTDSGGDLNPGFSSMDLAAFTIPYSLART